MSGEQGRWREPRSLLVAAAVGAALVWTTFSGAMVRPLLADMNIPYAGAVGANLSDLLVMAGLLALAGRSSGQALVRLSGLTAPAIRPIIWALLIFLPALAIAALTAPVSPELSLVTLFWQGLGFPIIEEVIYRGLAVGALIAWAGWPWWAACLAPAAMFGLVHAGQGADAGSIAGVVAVTGLGGLLFGWLFVRWKGNLWAPILLHVGMNSLWIVFALGETALGGPLGNVLRLAVVVAAVALTLRMAGGPPRLAVTWPAKTPPA